MKLTPISNHYQHEDNGLPFANIEKQSITSISITERNKNHQKETPCADRSQVCVCKFFFQAIDNVYYCLQFSWGESCISCSVVVLLCILHTTVSKIYCKIHTTSDWSPMYSSMTCFCNRNKRDDNDRCTIDCFFLYYSAILFKKSIFWWIIVCSLMIKRSGACKKKQFFWWYTIEFVPNIFLDLPLFLLISKYKVI